MAISFETGNPDVRGSLAVHIETERLYLHPVSQITDEYVSNYLQIFNHPAWTLNKDPKSFRKWLINCRNAWDAGDPFSAFQVDVKDSDTAIGSIQCEQGYKEGFTELSYSLKENAQKQGYGKEMVEVVVNHYLPLLKQKKFQVKNFYTADTTPLEGIEAYITTYSHPASLHILEKLKFKRVESSQCYQKLI